MGKPEEALLSMSTEAWVEYLGRAAEHNLSIDREGGYRQGRSADRAFQPAYEHRTDRPPLGADGSMWIPEEPLAGEPDRPETEVALGPDGEPQSPEDVERGPDGEPVAEDEAGGPERGVEGQDIEDEDDGGSDDADVDEDKDE